MAVRMMGLETEYALSGEICANVPASRRELTHILMHLATTRLPHMRGTRTAGIFLQNGGRFYIDIDSHPELTTPECTNPWDCVRYILAGDRILAKLACSIPLLYGHVRKVTLSKCNVDYSGVQTSWGCHESYLHTLDPALMPKAIIPHFVSRLIYTGAGGFDATSPGIKFILSPRVPYLTTEISAASQHDRGIYHTRDESLSKRGYHRLHVLCGESNCSHEAMWLKSATTALIVAMADASIQPGAAVYPANAVEAMNVFASDLTLGKEVQGRQTAALTALGIQRHYLECAEAHLHDEFMPPWAEAACRHWREMLDALAEGPDAVLRRLDWAIKYALFSEHIARRGFSWETIHQWNLVVDRTTESELPDIELPFNPEEPPVSSIEMPWDRIWNRFGRWLVERRLDEDRYRQFLALRNELFEIDVRFSELGEKGIFNSLDAAGVLSHRVAGVDNIEHAMENGPAEGRAGIRAAMIRSHGGNASNYTCEWDGILDADAHRWFDLTCPLNPAATWSTTRSEPEMAIPF